MKNVVEFPKSKIVRQAQVDVEAIELAKERSLITFADNIMDELIENLASDIENAGIDIEEHAFLKDFSLTVDALRATVYRTFGLPHSLHGFIDENVKVISRETGDPINSFDDVKVLDNED